MIWIPFYIAILATVYRCYGWRTMLLMGAMAGFAIAATDQTCASLLRPILRRLRPANPDNPISEYVHIVNGYRGGKYGFPSCHAANTFAVVALTSLLFKRWTYTISIAAWAAIVSYSRMYLGVHYPGDILTGMLVGLFYGSVFYVCAGFVLGLYVMAFPYKTEPRRIVATYKRGAPSIIIKLGDTTTTTSPIMMPILVGLLIFACILLYSFTTWLSWQH